MDFLNDRIPINLITGIFVNHAHRVTEFSSEAFVLRLFRSKNNTGWIKAISDEPEVFVQGIWKLEKSLKLLYQRHVSLWPRFQLQVKHDIESRDQVDMVELRIPLSGLMKKIQLALWECMEQVRYFKLSLQILAELKRSIPAFESEELTAENAIFKNFDFFLKQQLESMWHKVSSKTKSLLQDIKTIRRLLSYLTGYDCVTFLSFIETLISAALPSSIFKSDSSQWLLLDAAQVVISTAKSRVFRKKGGIIEPVLESQPKWKILMDILREITREKQEISKSNDGKDGILL